MLKKFKQATLQSLKTTGMSSLVEASRWRRQRLLILAYHGVSMTDEHLWNGSQFMSAEMFRDRLEQLKRSRSVVLPLDEAITRLYENDLPEKSVAITFDDGTADFYRRAFPLLREFGFPATLYLTTFYSHFKRPIFDLMCSYVLWKGRNHTLDLKKITGRDFRIDLRSEVSRDSACADIRAFADAQSMSAEEKDALLAALANELRVNYDELLAQRTLHVLTPDEVGQLPLGGIDVQLHTHRHRTPLDHELFLREIDDNRKSIYEMTGRSAAHFCYPSGAYDLRFLPWLEEAGIISATTCDIGFASPASNRLLLPRVIDTSALSAIEFESWLTGVSAVLPRRRRRSQKEKAA
jgi:peptidoglycan/xylan/chitin deacetylase (PgdA/CDA1 family)